MFDIEFLGTGNAAQVPVWGCRCGACAAARADPSRRRRSASLAIHSAGGVSLLDAGRTDLAERYSFEQVRRIILTHFHMDHVQGLFHLRWSEREEAIPLYRPDDEAGTDDLYRYPGVFDLQSPFQPGVEVKLSDFSIVPLALNHSRVTLGYVLAADRFRIAYLTDTVGLPSMTRDYLKRYPVDCLIVDCSEPPRSEPPRNHNDLTRALQLLELVGDGTLILTHISHRLDNWLDSHRAELPDRVVVARDGMCVRQRADGLLIE